MTTDAIAHAAPTVQEPELIGFVLSHSAFRAELPLLSAAFAAPMTPQVRDIAEDHLRLVTDHLLRHHEEEDTFHWPLLLARAPHASELLRRLEAEHVELDAAIAVARDRTAPIPVRAAALTRLERLVHDHTAQEDATVVPMLRRHITADEQAGSMARSRAKIPADDELRVLAIMLDAATPDERDRMLAPLPDFVIDLWQQHAAPALHAIHTHLANTAAMRDGDGN